ncbi:MAG: ERF family protein [Myxococcota bacterium]
MTKAVRSTQYATLGEALAAAQGDMKDPPKRKTNPHFKSSYAGMDDLLEVVRPVLAKHGIAFTQLLDILDSGRQVLVTRLWIGDGTGTNELVSRSLLPEVQDPQKARSAVTYARRTAFESIVGVAGCEDDDGESLATAARPQPAPHHVSWARDRARFCAALNQHGTSYDAVKAACEGRRWGKPSTWEQSKRDGLLDAFEEGTAWDTLGMTEPFSEATPAK